MKKLVPTFSVVVIELFFIGMPLPARDLSINATFPVPVFNSAASTSFTDICFDKQTGKLALCSDGGYGEFPIVNGKVQFGSPGFIAATGHFIIRGYANTPAGLSAVDNRGRVVFWGKNSKLSLPVDTGNISGMAWDGTRLWIARQIPARLFAFRLKNDRTLVLDQTVDFSFPILQSVTRYNQSLWVTDGSHVFRLDKRQQIVETWNCPRPINGFCFAATALYAVSIDGHEIYRLQIDGM